MIVHLFFLLSQTVILTAFWGASVGFQNQDNMFRQSVRRFGTTALRAAEGSTGYAVRVSQAQGYVNGLTEGTALAPYQALPRKCEIERTRGC